MLLSRGKAFPYAKIMHPFNPTLPLSFPRPFLWPVGTCAHQEGLAPALGGTMWEALAQSSSGRKSSDTNGACLENRKVDRLHLTTTARLINAPTASLLRVVTPDSILAINLLKPSTRLCKCTQYSSGRGWGGGEEGGGEQLSLQQRG